MLRIRTFGLVMTAALLLLGLGAAQAQPQAKAPGFGEGYGFAAKRPILGAACPNCPWGAVADVIKAAMATRGYDVQICYNCSGAPSVRLVSGALAPPPLRPDQKVPLPPNGPVDFGVTNVHRLMWAYEGLFDYAKEGPRRNLRAIALIEHPMYLAVAVKAASGVTDLAEIKAKRLPVRIMVNENPYTLPILAHYGITRAELESWGGRFIEERSDERYEFDVLIHNQAYLANSPEANIWYEATQRRDLQFLQLAEPLLQTMAKDLRMEIVSMPPQTFRGLDRPVRTVARSGQVVYGRADMPDAFAFALARALDQERRRFLWTPLPMSYNPATAPHALGVPLHPAAARYYRSAGYLK